MTRRRPAALSSLRCPFRARPSWTTSLRSCSKPSRTSSFYSPPDVIYTSYSCLSDEATALYICGVPPVAVAAMLGHKGNNTRTVISANVDVLAPSSPAFLRLCGLWLRRRP